MVASADREPVAAVFRCHPGRGPCSLTLRPFRTFEVWAQAVYEPAVALTVGVEPVVVAVETQLAVGPGEAFSVIDEN